MTLQVCLTACGPDDCNLDLTNDVDPVAGTPAVLVEEDGIELWQVRWDNPVVGGNYQMPTGAVEGYAERKDNGWVYNKFDLLALAEDADGLHDLVTWPEFPGKYGVDRPLLLWETHGLQLAPRITGASLEAVATVQAFHDTWNQPTAPYLGPGLFELAPDVVLLPVFVVVLYGPGVAGYPALPAGWVSNEEARLLFDDVWRPDKSVNYDFQYDPDDVVGNWTYRAGCHGQVGCQSRVQSPDSLGSGYLQPDRVFDLSGQCGTDPCGIQFRMVSFSECEAPAELIWNTKKTCDPNARGLSVRQYVELNCPSAPWGTHAVGVVFTGGLVDYLHGDCGAAETLGGQVGKWAFISKNGTAYRNVLSHELGHVLSLLDIPQGQCSPENLMCASASAQSTVLTCAQCEDARSTAHAFADAYWGP